MTIKKIVEDVKHAAVNEAKSQITSFAKHRADIMAKEAKSRASMMFGNKRPLLPERSSSFMTGAVDDKPHFVYE